MRLNEILLHDVMPAAPMEWLAALVRELPSSGIDTPNEIASFIAQIAHESSELTRLEENLNYSAERLMVVWPRHFPSYEIAKKYEHDSQRLANYVYDDTNRSEKSKLGNIWPGDGWEYHGRGPLQLTGRTNYTQCGDDIGVNLVTHPELVLTPPTGIQSALWYWRVRGLDAVDDDTDVRIDTRRVNGGENGLVNRQAYFNRCLKLLEAT